MESNLNMAVSTDTATLIFAFGEIEIQDSFFVSNIFYANEAKIHFKTNI